MNRIKLFDHDMKGEMLLQKDLFDLTGALRCKKY